MKRVSSVCVLFLLAFAAAPTANVSAKPQTSRSAALPAQVFLGAWGDTVVPREDPDYSMKYQNPASVQYTNIEILPRGRFLLIKFNGIRKSVTRGTYRIEGERLVATHTIPNTRPPSFPRGRNYTATVRTFFRLAGRNHLDNDHTVLRYVDNRDQSVHRFDWRGGNSYRKIKPKQSLFQLI